MLANPPSPLGPLQPYLRHAHYYETDKMGIIHHANYLHWMEEARIDLMDQLGFSYQRLESMGIMIPVVSLQCDYKRPVEFDDLVEIHVQIAEYTGVRLRLEYRMINLSNGQICTTGSSEHCFFSQESRLISLQRNCPDLHALLAGLLPPAPEEM